VPPRNSVYLGGTSNARRAEEPQRGRTQLLVSTFHRAHRCFTVLTISFVDCAMRKKYDGQTGSAERPFRSRSSVLI
jgi:hypothetical protein